MKTNKLPEVIRMQMDQGITKFKCATIAEAEMIAACGAPDVLLAYQPVGPNVERFVELVQKFPARPFSALADDARDDRALSRAAVRRGRHAESVPGPRLRHAPHRRRAGPGGDRALSTDRDAARVCAPQGCTPMTATFTTPICRPRTQACDEAFAPVAARAGRARSGRIAGADGRRRRHADVPDPRAARRTSSAVPARRVFWDLGYSTILPDLDFLPAVLVLTRVVSKPGNEPSVPGSRAQGGRVGEPAAARVSCWACRTRRASATARNTSMLETDSRRRVSGRLGFYGMPWHICPTVALHQEAVVVRNGRAEERWQVVGRGRGRSRSDAAAPAPGVLNLQSTP